MEWQVEDDAQADTTYADRLFPPIILLYGRASSPIHPSTHPSTHPMRGVWCRPGPPQALVSRSLSCMRQALAACLPACLPAGLLACCVCPLVPFFGSSLCLSQMQVSLPDSTARRQRRPKRPKVVLDSGRLRMYSVLCAEYGILHHPLPTLVLS